MYGKRLTLIHSKIKFVYKNYTVIDLDRNLIKLEKKHGDILIIQLFSLNESVHFVLFHARGLGKTGLRYLNNEEIEYYDV